MWELDTVRRAADYGAGYGTLPKQERSLAKLPGLIGAYILGFFGRHMLRLPVDLTVLMCAVHSRRHINVLLLLMLRERGLIQFSLDAVNSRNKTAAQMSYDPETTDVLLLVQALDGADVHGEQRAAFLSR